jgi:hypothetical protein
MNCAAAIKLELALDDPRIGSAGRFRRARCSLPSPRGDGADRVQNPTDQHTRCHLHGHSARLLDALDDGWKPYWLDTILAPPQRRRASRFVADNRGKWLIESQVSAAKAAFGRGSKSHSGWRSPSNSRR